MTLCLWLLPALSAGAAEVTRSSIERQDGHYRVRLDILLAAPAEPVRALLRDHHTLRQLNDAIIGYEVLQEWEHHHRARVTLQACVFFFCVTTTQVQDIGELPSGAVAGTLLPAQGQFRQGWWRLTVLALDPARSRLQVDADLVPDFWIPPLIGPWLMQRKFRREALESCERLERLAPASPPHASR